MIFGFLFRAKTRMIRPGKRESHENPTTKKRMIEKIAADADWEYLVPSCHKSSFHPITHH
jgi:hypothetical protein